MRQYFETADAVCGSDEGLAEARRQALSSGASAPASVKALRFAPMNAQRRAALTETQ
jgi:hypothetical protein